MGFRVWIWGWDRYWGFGCLLVVFIVMECNEFFLRVCVGFGERRSGF